jgi:hypothetical protein
LFAGYWQATPSGWMHTPPLQTEKVSQVCVGSPGVQGAPSATTMGHVPPGPPRPASGECVSGHAPTRQSSTSPHVCPAGIQVIVAHVALAMAQAKPAAQSWFDWQGAPRGPGGWQVSATPPSPSVQVSGAVHPAGPPQLAPALPGAAHRDEGTSQ